MGVKLNPALQQSSLLLINKRFGNEEKQDLPLEDYYVSGVDKCKHLGVVLTETVIVTEK